MSEFPKEYQTNKNLRYWLSNRPNEDICSSPDDFFLHETEAVEFAKQFNCEEIQHLESEIKKRDELLREAVTLINTAHYRTPSENRSKFGATEYSTFFNKPEIKKILEGK